MKKLFTLALLVVATNTFAQNYTIPVTGLQTPVAFTFTPNGNILVTEKAGRIKVFDNTGAPMGTFCDISDSTDSYGELGLLGIEVDPLFAINHYVYAFYVHRYPALDSLVTTNRHLRVVRFTESNNVGTNPMVILDLTANNIAANHVGGNIHFSPTDPNNLYVAVGDITIEANAQDLLSNFGKILRVGKDGSIPTDNPYYGQSFGSWYVWSYGHRNPFDFCFSPTGTLFNSENGASDFDEVNLVEPGNNYGWPICEGNCNDTLYENPIETWGAPVPALTGIVYYSGFGIPQLNNHLLVADFNNGYIYNLELGGVLLDSVVSRATLMDLPPLTTLRQGPDGALYAMHIGDTDGSIYKITSITGIDENLAKQGYTLYPNPANTTLYVPLSNQHIESIQLYNAAGTMVLSQPVNGKEIATIDISALPVGMYYTALIGKQQRHTIQWVKE